MAASKSQTGESGTPQETRQAEEQRTQDVNAADAGFMGNTGPGTGKNPAKDDTTRMPTQQPVHAESGPLNPDDAKQQIKPEHGYADSSTNHTYAEAGGRTIAGEDHVGLEDEDGGKVSGGLFESASDDSPYMVAKQTVVEVFTYANAPDYPVKRILLNKGKRVPRAQATKIEQSLQAKQEPTFASQKGQDRSKGSRTNSDERVGSQNDRSDKDKAKA